MPLADIKCANGHLTEVLIRGGGNAPSVCPTCGADASRQVSTFNAYTTVYPDAAPEYVGKVSRYAPAVIDRMGGGKAVKTAEGGYRPALTHNGVCPQCKRRRNVAIVNQTSMGPRPMCEACGYTWIHHADTASDPLFEGVNDAYRPGKTFAGRFSGYTPPERAA